jgi:hypothetical protein
MTSLSAEMTSSRYSCYYYWPVFACVRERILYTFLSHVYHIIAVAMHIVSRLKPLILTLYAYAWPQNEDTSFNKGGACPHFLGS